MKAISSAVVIIAFLLLGLLITGFSFPSLQPDDKTIQLIPGSARESSVILKNIGTTQLWFSELTVIVNGQAAETLNTRARLNPGESKILFFHSPLFGENMNITITGPTNTISYTMSISPQSLEASCTDGTQNQDETDVDCGGDICERCSTGSACLTNSDCVSNNCSTNICEPLFLPCSGLGGVICLENETCNGTIASASDGDCCIGICETYPQCSDNDGDGFFLEAGCGTAVDCNDSNPNTYPSATELCSDELDNDCDGLTDAEDADCWECSPEGATQPCDTGLLGVCSAGTETCTNGYWGSCIQNTTATDEICDDELDNDCDGEIDEECDFILTYWGPYIDSSEMTTEKWNDYLGYFNQLRDIGFTHAGIHIWNINPSSETRELIASRIADLRNDNFDIVLHQSSGHRILDEPDELDPENHTSNGQNLKYFDSLDFDPYECDPRCDCSEEPSRLAHDPAYDGVVWQKELDFLVDLMEWAGIGENELVIFDTEIWGTKPDIVNWCYPGVLDRSVARYTGTSEERLDQYYNYWKQRGLDLTNIVTSRDSDIGVYFYGENIPELEQEKTWMPGGVGDAPSPSHYYMPNITLIIEELDKGNFSGSYPWISFSTTNYKWVHIYDGQPNAGWITIQWDPRITQKVAFMYREQGISGIFVYPGPTHHDVSPDYYMTHAQAFYDGFVNGIDPGELVEECDDGMDNDGDGEIDEGC